MLEVMHPFHRGTEIWGGTQDRFLQYGQLEATNEAIVIGWVVWFHQDPLKHLRGDAKQETPYKIRASKIGHIMTILQLVKKQNEQGLHSLTSKQLERLHKAFVYFERVNSDGESYFDGLNDKHWAHIVEYDRDSIVEWGGRVAHALKIKSGIDPSLKATISNKTIKTYNAMLEKESIEEFEDMEDKEQQALIKKYLTPKQIKEVIALMEHEAMDERMPENFEALDFWLESLHYEAMYEIVKGGK